MIIVEEAQFIGEAIKTIITLGAFVAIVVKFIQPINELRIVIQKLNDNIDAMKKDNENHEKRINNHGSRLDDHEKRINTLEIKVGTYHKNDE